jgi:hypothetical protein
MKTASDSTVLTSPEYRRFIEDLKARVISARICAARAVNRDLILLYWDIGHGIVEKQKTLGWGDAVVEMVAADLRRAFPAGQSFSPDNLWRMRQFYLAYSTPEFLGQAVPEKQRTAPAGVKHAILGQPVPETGPATALDGQNPLLDLLAALPWGQNLLMDFYLNLLNDKERGPDDNASIGIILCAEKDNVEVEYALKSKHNPIEVAEYQLQSKLPAELKGKLPTARQLAEVVRSTQPAKEGKRS